MSNLRSRKKTDMKARRKFIENASSLWTKVLVYDSVKK